MKKSEKPFLSIIVLNWNRENLLRGTVLSLLATTKFPYELFVIDNGSSDGSANWLNILASRFTQVKLILLKKNKGGEAINLGLEKARGDFCLISENDLEYSPDWDRHMVRKFEVFQKLGQLSPMSPYPLRDLGEKWVDKPARMVTQQGVSVYMTDENVGTSCMIRRDVFKKGVRWQNIRSSKNNFKFPADPSFSRDIRKLGYDIAWSDKYQVINWGHMEVTWKSDSGYYNANWEAKSEYDIDGLKKFKSPIKSLGGDADALALEHSKLLLELYDLKNQKNIVSTVDLQKAIAVLKSSAAYRVGNVVLFPLRPFLKFARKFFKFLRVVKNRNRGVK